MVKKGGLITVIAIVIVLASVNVFLFVSKGQMSYVGISGNVIDELPELPFNLTLPTTLFIIQGLILIIILLFTYSKFLKHKKEIITKQDYNIIKEKKTKSETDMDVLYHLLKSRKKINIGSISRIFNISKEKALEWAKTLENYELVNIEYPAFTDPEVKINEKESENIEKQETKPEQQEAEKKKSKISKLQKKKRSKKK